MDRTGQAERDPDRPRHVDIGLALGLISWLVILSFSVVFENSLEGKVIPAVWVLAALALLYGISRRKNWARIGYSILVFPAFMVSVISMLDLVFLAVAGFDILGLSHTPGGVTLSATTIVMSVGAGLLFTAGSRAWFRAGKGSLDTIIEVLTGRIETTADLEAHREQLSGRLAEARQARKTASEQYAADGVSFEELQRARERETAIEEYIESAEALLAANSELGDEIESARSKMQAAEARRREAAEAYTDGDIDYEELEQAKENADEVKATFQRISSRSLVDLVRQVRPDRWEPSIASELKESLSKVTSGFQPSPSEVDEPPTEPHPDVRAENKSDRQATDFWGRFSMPEKVAFGSAIGVIVGGLGPWVDVILKTGYGAQGDGWFLAVGAGVILYLLGRGKATSHLWVLALFLFTGLFTGWKISAFLGVEMFGETIGWELMSWGLPVAMASSVVGLMATVSAILGGSSPGMDLHRRAE